MINIDWINKIIHIPKADLPLVQSSPSEIRELDLYEFHLMLRNLEGEQSGLPFKITHNYTTNVSISNLTLAKVIEIINDYTIEFENGSYAVNIINGNSNVLDKVIFNNVSVRSSNSAGLIEVNTGSLSNTDIELISDKSAFKTWEELLANHDNDNTFGKFVKSKLLSLKLWLALR